VARGTDQEQIRYKLVRLLKTFYRGLGGTSGGLAFCDGCFNRSCAGLARLWTHARCASLPGGQVLFGLDQIGSKIRLVMGRFACHWVKRAVGRASGQMGWIHGLSVVQISNRARDSQQPLGGPGAEPAAA